MTTYETLYKMIDDLPSSDDGWWKKDTPNILNSVGKELLDKGISLEQSFNIISKIYYAVCEEFGV